MSDIQYVMVMHDGSRATKFMSEDYCKDLMEQLAAAQSGEVCTKPHADDVLEFCQACKIESLQARLAEAERDAARYRFIKQWVRRLDITGYSLTNNEYFEPRIDQAMGRTADSAASQPPPVITFPEDMSTAERIGDPRIDGQPSAAPFETTGVKFYRMQRRGDPGNFADFDPHLWALIVVPADNGSEP